jgi:hypothetical protein
MVPRTCFELIYMRDWKYSSTVLNLSQHWMEVSGQLHVQAALPPGKEARYPLKQAG